MVTFQIKHINKVKSKGRLYYYDRISGKRITAPFGTVEFMEEVKELRQAHQEKRPVIKKGTFGSLILDYQMSQTFAGLAPRTKADYRAFSKKLEKLHNLVLADLTTPDIANIRDRLAKKHTRDQANRLKNYMSILFNWGIPYGHIKFNPAEKVPNLKKTREERAKKANRPWTQNELKNALEHTYPEMRVAIALAAYTSLREQDVIKVPWSAIKDGWLEWVHNKTGAAFEAPISNELRIILDQTKKTAVTIVTGIRGNSYAGVDGFKSNFQKERNRLAKEGYIGKDCTFHGLRHTVLTAVAEEGATAAEIMSLSGHRQESQVRRYTETATRKKSAEKMVSLLDKRNKK